MYKCYKIIFKRGGPIIDSPDWIEEQKLTADKCSWYAVTVALNDWEIKWNPERISNIKPFIYSYI